MFQTDTVLNPELTQAERRIAIRKAFNSDRSQMTLMLAHRLQIPEVEILRALGGDHPFLRRPWQRACHCLERSNDH